MNLNTEHKGKTVQQSIDDFMKQIPAEGLYNKIMKGDSCPPATGGCPYMYRYMPPGHTETCPSCGREVVGNSITF